MGSELVYKGCSRTSHCLARIVIGDSGILDEPADSFGKDWQGITFRKGTKSEDQKIEEKRTRSRLVF